MKSHQAGWAAACAALLLAATPAEGATLSVKTSFGGGDGWRAPGEVIAGDTAGTGPGGVYSYLGATHLERGLAYNPATGNLILVSRSTVGNGVRVLNGSTGADAGFLPQGTGVISGGTFTTNMVGVADDGAIYVANLQANVSTAAFKVYQWTSEAAAAPTAYFNSTIAGYSGTPRNGDSLDVTGAGANTTIVAGTNGSVGYSIITASGGVGVASFAPTGPVAGDFRLGVTFGPTASDVWGKQTGTTAAASPVRLTSYSGATGTSNGAAVVTNGREIAMDYAVVGGVPLLATLDADTSLLRIYNMTTATSPVLIASGTSTTGTLTANSNATGSVKFGAISGSSAVIYAMSTNQGIQAFELTGVPEPSSMALLGVAVVGCSAIRRRVA